MFGLRFLDKKKYPKLIQFQYKNTIRDGGSTTLYAAYTIGTADTVYTVLMVYTVDMVYTVNTVNTVDTGMRGTTMGKTGLMPETPFGK